MKIQKGGALSPRAPREAGSHGMNQMKYLCHLAKRGCLGDAALPIRGCLGSSTGSDSTTMQPYHSLR